MISMNKSDDTSLSSTIDINEENTKSNQNQSQRYSLARHPVYPILACSDGFLMCILRINSAYSTQPRLIRELVNTGLDLLNSLKNQSQPLNIRPNRNTQKGI
jgi:hypothetical protein